MTDLDRMTGNERNRKRNVIEFEACSMYSEDAGDSSRIFRRREKGGKSQ